jgi:hypothetical protein
MTVPCVVRLADLHVRPPPSHLSSC